jgi:SSS family solute:Na+ symporter
MLNIAVGIVWQMTLTLVPIYFVLREFRRFWAAAAMLMITSVFLKKNWYDKLEKDEVRNPEVKNEAS